MARRPSGASDIVQVQWPSCMPAAAKALARANGCRITDGLLMPDRTLIVESVTVFEQPVVKKEPEEEEEEEEKGEEKAEVTREAAGEDEEPSL